MQYQRIEEAAPNSRELVFQQVRRLGSTLSRCFSEGCVSSCQLYLGTEDNEFHWELSMNNATGPLRKEEAFEEPGTFVALTHFTFASLITQLLMGLARNGQRLLVTRYNGRGFSIGLEGESLSLSVSYEPTASSPTRVAYFALLMDGISFNKPIERLLVEVSPESLNQAVEITLVELRSYLTTKRLRGRASPLHL